MRIPPGFEIMLDVTGSNDNPARTFYREITAESLSQSWITGRAGGGLCAPCAAGAECAPTLHGRRTALPPEINSNRRLQMHKRTMLQAAIALALAGASGLSLAQSN